MLARGLGASAVHGLALASQQGLTAPYVCLSLHRVAACDLILEYTLSAAAIAKGFTAYMASLCGADLAKVRLQVRRMSGWCGPCCGFLGLMQAWVPGKAGGCQASTSAIKGGISKRGHSIWACADRGPALNVGLR